MIIDKKTLEQLLNKLSKEDRAELDQILKDPKQKLNLLTDFLRTLREWKKYDMMHDHIRDALRTH